MIYNYIKCESVIAKILADLDSTEAHQRISDIREWIFEAVEKIGAPMQYICAESGDEIHPILKIEDYQVPLPSDLHSLDGVAYSLSPTGPWVPIAKSTGIFKIKHNKPSKLAMQFAEEYDHENKTIVWDLENKHIVPNPEKLMTSQSQMYKSETLEQWSKRHRHLYSKIEYYVKPGWLVLNVPKGFVKLAFKTIATDDRGYPLIPDNASYQEAIYWYVTMKLAFPKWMKGTLGGRGVNTGQNLYQYIQQQWHFYRNQAYAECMMPTTDDMRNIKNDWNKLIPEYTSDSIFFDNQGDAEISFNDYYNGY